MDKPTWWPENPYPESIFPMTIEEYVDAVPDPKLRTAISGCMARFGWKVASDQIWLRYKEAMDG